MAHLRHQVLPLRDRKTPSRHNLILFPAPRTGTQFRRQVGNDQSPRHSWLSRNADGRMPIQAAFFEGQMDVVNYLLSVGQSGSSSREDRTSPRQENRSQVSASGSRDQ